MPTVLWWGRGDPGYSRNRVVLSLFADLGWRVERFRPFSSPLGRWQARLAGLARPDLVWVPCFRQTDLPSAAAWARRWGAPLVADPLISAFQKEVFERRKYEPGSRAAEGRRRWEAKALSHADAVVCDTVAHARYFERNLGVDADRLSVLFVGAEQGLFAHRPMAGPPAGPLEVLFYGSFLRLQGPGVIPRAAALCADLPARWTLLGDGDLLAETRERAQGMANVVFEPWIPYADLPARIARAHVVLGVFGDTEKADLVIPNKVYQAMAVGRSLVTRQASAYEGVLAGHPDVGWVPPADPEALAARVREYLSDPDSLPQRGERVRKLYERHFSQAALRDQLSGILEKALASREKVTPQLRGENGGKS